MRAFVSVDCEGLEDGIERVQRAVGAADGLECLAPERVHVTVFFLGEFEADRLDRVDEAIEAGIESANLGPFTISFGGLGVFPSREYIRTLWVGVREGDEPLGQLHREIGSRLERIGFTSDEHAFTPHATIARLRHAGSKAHVQRRLDALDPALGRLRVEDIGLTESTLTEAGPVYDTLERYRL
jgi:RNA 2',3'-cyclic 3'-phosphodiesterase